MKTNEQAALSALKERVKSVGFICPMDCELAAVTRLFDECRTETVGGHVFTLGTVSGVSAVAVRCGVGKVFAAAAAQAMILRFAPDLIITTGIAGNLSPDLAIGDVVVSQSVVQHDMDTSPLGDPVGLISGINRIYLPADADAAAVFSAVLTELGIHHRAGTVASGDRFVASAAERERIVRLFSADCCEMEGAAVGQVAYVSGVPFVVLRALSDDADNAAPADFPAYCLTVAEKTSGIVARFMELLSKRDKIC